MVSAGSRPTQPRDRNGLSDPDQPFGPEYAFNKRIHTFLLSTPWKTKVFKNLQFLLTPYVSPKIDMLSNNRFHNKWETNFCISSHRDGQPKPRLRRPIQQRQTVLPPSVNVLPSYLLLTSAVMCTWCVHLYVWTEVCVWSNRPHILFIPLAAPTSLHTAEPEQQSYSHQGWMTTWSHGMGWITIPSGSALIF